MNEIIKTPEQVCQVLEDIIIFSLLFTFFSAIAIYGVLSFIGLTRYIVFFELSSAIFIWIDTYRTARSIVKEFSLFGRVLL